MTVKEFIEMLQQYPEDYEIEFANYFFMDTPTGSLLQVEDNPIIALAENDKDNKLRLVVGDSNSEVLDFLENDVEMLI